MAPSQARVEFLTKAKASKEYFVSPTEVVSSAMESLAVDAAGFASNSTDYWWWAIDHLVLPD